MGALNIKKLETIKFTSWIWVVVILCGGCAPFHWGAPPEHDGPPSNAGTAPRTVATDHAPSPLLSWPVDRDARITQEFKNSTFKRHDGLDIANYSGAPIYAAHEGWVSYVGSDFRGYGRMVILETGVGWTTLYGHCKKILVREGMHIYRGQQIALMGKTGNAAGVHLHFELMKRSQPVDPLLYLP